LEPASQAVQGCTACKVHLDISSWKKRQCSGKIFVVSESRRDIEYSRSGRDKIAVPQSPFLYVLEAGNARRLGHGEVA
jgi:hypothetical protein